MLLPDLQMVLDRLVSNYEHISPQILRSAVEYAKMSASAITVEDDDPSQGKDALYARAQGYVEGYCKIYDGFYNPNASEVVTSEATRFAMANIRSDFGEEAPTCLLSACGDYLITISSGAAELSTKHVSSLLLLAGIGFMDGAIDADLDIASNEHIKPVYPPYPMSSSEQAYDIVAGEVSLRIDNEDAAREMKQIVCADLVNMMSHVIYPRSGNGEIRTEDSLACAMMYLGGYIKGLLGENGTGLDVSELATLSEPQEDALYLADSLLTMWVRYRGHSVAIAREASDAMRDTVLTDNLFFNGSASAAEISMAALYGMGYSDGRWFSMSDDAAEDDKAISELEISDEIDFVFAMMPPDGEEEQ